MFELFTPEILASLATLTILEIVLGIDNIIFISIVASRLPKAQQPLARKLGLLGALVIRLLFLTLVAWIIGLEATLFNAFGIDFSWKDLIQNQKQRGRGIPLETPETSQLPEKGYRSNQFQV